MKRILCAAMILILTGCATKPADPTDIVSTPAATQTPEAAVMPAPEATKAPAASETEATETPTAESTSYTAIMLPMRDTYPPVMLAEDDLVSDGYYTMCQDGKWGLMRSDGSEVLPCRAPEPLFACGLGNRHWHDYTNGLSWEAADALRKEYARQLQACGDGVICDGHDGDGYLEFVYLQEHTVSIYSGILGPGEFSAPTEDDLLRYSGSANGPVPTCGGTIHRESDDWYYFVSDGQYAYRYKDGTAANDSIYTAADFFFDAPLAPAQRDGKWVYLDTAGREVTEPCYDSVYVPDYYTEEPLVYRRAAPLLNGYAPVSRDGKFGLLDSTGAEFVPCAYDGLVWDGGTAWVKLADGWHEYSIPGVTKPDPLDDLPESIVAPDTRPTRTDIVFFSVDTAGERLNVRTGPGLEYDILDKLSDSAQVRLYGALSTAPGWALVKYGRKFGWVSQDFLVLGR